LAITLKSRSHEESLPYYDSLDFTPRWTASHHRIGAFNLTKQTGAPLSAVDLRGKIHIATFLYTRCAGICPQIVQRLKAVDNIVAEMQDVRLVSFSVTPDLDSPGDLAAFGAARGIDPVRWFLLTGDRRTIYRLARESYFADDGRLQAQGAPDTSFLHTEKALLVDKQGRLRGVYNATQAFEIEHLIEDLHTLRLEVRANYD
jgi:protein SCO1/2